jgi:hypothetical protein
MSDPSKNEISGKRIRQINMRFLIGAVVFYLGHVCWRNASVVNWPLWLFGGIFMIGGGSQFLKTSLEVIELIISQFRWGKFRKQGVKPRADRMARDSDFIDGGHGS